MNPMVPESPHSDLRLKSYGISPKSAKNRKLKVRIIACSYKKIGINLQKIKYKSQAYARA